MDANDEHSQSYKPEFLPDLVNIQQWSEGLAHQANKLHNSGQRIVSDFRQQWQNLAHEAEQIEAERLAAIRQINDAHKAKLDRNEKMRQQVEAMIDFYTGHVPSPKQTHVIDVTPRPRSEVAVRAPRKKIMGLF
jgi:hypothetical protein